MRFAPYLAAGALLLAFGVTPATAAGSVTPAAAEALAAAETETSPLILAATRRGRGHRGRRGRDHRGRRGRGHRGRRGRDHRGRRGRGHRGRRGRDHRGRRRHRRDWHGRGPRWREHRHRGAKRRFQRHIRRRRLHRGRFHDKYWRHGPTFGFWFGYPLYLYNYWGYDCHRVTVRDYWRGQYALIGGTLCYDELGYPYLVRRWLIRYLGDPYGYYGEPY